MKRYTILAIIIFSLAAAPAAVAEDVSADAASILRETAEHFRPIFRVLDAQTLYFLLEIAAEREREFEEWEVLERLAGSERGKEVVAAACREALAGDDPLLKLIAFRFLSEARGAEADAYLADLYDNLGEGDALILAFTFATGVAEEFYARLERDLAGDDRAARLKAATSIALMDSERARALAARGMQSPDADVRRWCVMNLCGRYDDPAEEPSHYEALEAALRDEDPSVRASAARPLADAGDAKFVAPLLPLLEDRDVSVRRAAARSIASLLEDESAADKGVAKKLLKRLKAEGDGVTRCYLAEAYGAATAKEGYEKDLTDDGYCAFFAGAWREKDLASYYEEYESERWYGDLVPFPELLEEAPAPVEPPVWEIPGEEVAGPEEAEEAPVAERPVFRPTKAESLNILDNVLGAAAGTLGWDNVFCAISLDKSVDLFGELQPYYAPGAFDRTFIDDAIVTLGNVKTWIEEKTDKLEGIDPTGVDAKDKKKQIRNIRARVKVMVIPPPVSEPIPEWEDDPVKKEMHERGELLKRKWAERGKK